MREDAHRRMVHNLNSLLADVLNIADAVDRRAEKENVIYLEALGLGYRALTSHLREGAKAIVDMEEELTEAREQVKNAKIEEQERTDFLKDVFGDEEVAESFIEEEKQRLRDLVAEIEKEWLEEEEND